MGRGRKSKSQKMKNRKRQTAKKARLKKRRGAKKAIVAIARRMLTVIYSILKQGRPYQLVAG